MNRDINGVENIDFQLAPKRSSSTGRPKEYSFVSFILLSEPKFSFDKLCRDLQVDVGKIVRQKDFIMLEHQGMIMLVALKTEQIPSAQLEEAIANAEDWPQADLAAQTHKANLMLVVMRQEQPWAAAGALMAKLACCCLQQPMALAVFVAAKLIKPDYYRNIARAYLKIKAFPVLNLIHIGLYSSDQGQTVSGFTYGLSDIGKEEIEIIDSRHSPDEVMHFLHTVTDYLISCDVTLRDGETIGFSQEQRLPISQSFCKVLNLPSLKIDF